MKRSLVTCAALVLAAPPLAAGLAPAASAALGPAVLVSRASGVNGAAGNGGSLWPSVSADGRKVAFMSEASNLHPDDRDREMDVFVRDLETHTTTLVSRATGAAGVSGKGASDSPSISADGRWVVFSSSASNLAPDAPYGGIFVRDLDASTTTLLGTRGLWPAMSSHGALLAYVSHSSSSEQGRTRTASIVVHDLLASTSSSPVQWAEPDQAIFLGGDEFFPALTADGALAFSTGIPIPAAGDTDEITDVFVHDLRTGTTSMASRRSGPGGAEADSSSHAPSISADGRLVAFTSSATNLDPAAPQGGVFVRNLETSTTSLASRASGQGGAAGDSQSFAPSLSADGRLLSFASSSSNLHPNDPGRGPDVYVRDLETGTTVLVTRGDSRRSGDDPEYAPYRSSLSADGQLVVFDSDASNLHREDRDPVGDVFARSLGPPPLPEPPRASCEGRPATIILLPGSARVRGRQGPDVVVGTEGADWIRGGGGNDRICGGGGADRVWGGSGRDLLVGGEGDDRLEGGRRDDRLVGGAGDDRLDGGSGRDRILAGTGRDIIPAAGRFADHVNCGPGRDVVITDAFDRVARCER